jgi:hypothetical protein
MLIGCMMLGAPLFATTYYVDYSSGNDSNNGTAKTSPWQHAPGMQTCTSTCKSTTIKAGDSIILKGGVTWPNASFEWSLPSGSSSSPVYVGVDQTWYTGSSWVRPILTAGGAVVGNNNNVMISIPSNVTFDNFEITGYYWTTASCTGYPNCAIINMGQTSGQTVENLYIHGWTHPGTNSSSSNGVATGILQGAGGTSVAHDIVIVGTDVPGDHSLTAFYGGPPIVYNVYCKQVASCFITGYQTSVHDNHIEDVGPAYCNIPTLGYCTHENGFEDNGDTGLVFYNNVITNIGAGLALWIAPNPGYTVTMWNNVIYAVHDNQIMDLAPPVYSSTLCSAGQTSNGYCLAAGNYVVLNNTVECGDDTTQYDLCQSGVGVIGSGAIANSVVFENNHFISLTTASGCSTGSGKPLSCSFTSNVVQTLATANSQGYNSSETYAFSPTGSSGGTVGKGANLTSSSPGCSTAGMSSLCSDTTYAVALNFSNHTPSSPARTVDARPSSGAWDAGAYLFSASTPQPPQKLQNQVNP